MHKSSGHNDVVRQDLKIQTFRMHNSLAAALDPARISGRATLQAGVSSTAHRRQADALCQTCATQLTPAQRALARSTVGVHQPVPALS